VEKEIWLELAYFIVFNNLFIKWGKPRKNCAEKREKREGKLEMVKKTS